MRDLMFAAIWMVALPISFVSPYSGVLLWVWVAMLSPNELLYGFMAGVPFNKLVAVTTIMLLFLSKERPKFYMDGLLWVMVGLLVLATLSFSVSIVPSDDGTELYIKLVKAAVLTFAITATITSRHRIHLLILAIVVPFSFLGVKEGLISVLTAGGHTIVGSGSIGDNNSLATALLMVVPLIFYLYRYSEVRFVQLTMVAVLALFVITTVMTFSRGGFIGLLVVGAMTIKNSKSKIGSFALVLSIGVLVYSFAPSSWFERLNTIESASNDQSFMGRVVAWKMSLLIALDHPLLGGGMHAVQRGAVWSAYRPFLPTVNFVNTPLADVIPHAAHSIYFEVLGDLGFLGLAVYLLLLFMSFWRCRQIIRLARRVPNLQWAVDLGRMIEISLIVFFITAAALSMAYFELFYILVGLISCCHHLVREELAAITGPLTATSTRPIGFVPGPLAQPHALTQFKPTPNRSALR